MTTTILEEEKKGNGTGAAAHAGDDDDDEKKHDKHDEHDKKKESDKPEKNEIGGTGRTWLWITFIAMLLPTIYFFVSMWSQDDKYFHAITTYTTGCAALAYLMMACGNGFVFVGNRQFFYIRYIDWLITTPLLLLDLLGLCNAAFDLQFAVIGADILMIVSGLAGAMFTSAVKWGFWTFGMLMFCPVVFYIATGLTVSANEVGHNASALFSRLGWLTVISWSFYPLMWILAEGLDSIPVDVEVVGYSLLDICAKSVFGLMLVFSRDALEEAWLKRAGRLSVN